MNFLIFQIETMSTLFFPKLNFEDLHGSDCKKRTLHLYFTVEKIKNKIKN